MRALGIPLLVLLLLVAAPARAMVPSLDLAGVVNSLTQVYEVMEKAVAYREKLNMNKSLLKQFGVPGWQDGLQQLQQMGDAHLQKLAKRMDVLKPWPDAGSGKDVQTVGDFFEDKLTTLNKAKDAYNPMNIAARRLEQVKSMLSSTIQGYTSGNILLEQADDRDAEIEELALDVSAPQNMRAAWAMNTVVTMATVENLSVINSQMATKVQTSATQAVISLF